MMRLYRTEIDATTEQQPKSLQTMGACRPLYTRCIATNRARRDDGLPF